jgi:heme-degrading monooxygenase HmoA
MLKRNLAHPRLFLRLFLKRVILPCVLICMTVVTFSVPAQAGKMMSSLTFDDSSGIVEVVAIYETSYSTQKSIVKSLKINNKLIKKALGFKGFSLLQSQDGKQAIAFSQWQDLASYQAYIPAITTDSSKVNAADTLAVPPVPTKTLMFEVVTTQMAIVGAKPALRGKEAVVQLAQFTAKNPDARSQTLNIVEKMLPTILQNQPIPQSVILLKAIDSEDVALMTNWNCSAMFEDVGKPKAIAVGSDLEAIADSEQNLYNVITIIPAELKKDKADKKG